VRVCADGGANSLLEYSQNCQEASLPSPHWIIGDLDSLSEEARVYYSQLAEIINNSDQDSTGLDKCLAFLAAERQSSSSSTSCPIFVFGALGGGRFDQVFANIHSMHKFFHISICLLSDSSYAFLLKPGEGEIVLDPKFDGPSCGIIPFSNQETRVFTTGLL
jgi:thiamine pyrophosphokinase